MKKTYDITCYVCGKNCVVNRFPTYVILGEKPSGVRWWIQCLGCEYSSGLYKSQELAIEAHKKIQAKLVKYDEMEETIKDMQKTIDVLEARISELEKESNSNAEYANLLEANAGDLSWI